MFFLVYFNEKGQKLIEKRLDETLPILLFDPMYMSEQHYIMDTFQRQVIPFFMNWKQHLRHFFMVKLETTFTTVLLHIRLPS